MATHDIWSVWFHIIMLYPMKNVIDVLFTRKFYRMVSVCVEIDRDTNKCHRYNNQNVQMTFIISVI